MLQRADGAAIGPRREPDRRGRPRLMRDAAGLARVVLPLLAPDRLFHVAGRVGGIAVAWSWAQERTATRALGAGRALVLLYLALLALQLPASAPPAGPVALSAGALLPA